MRVFSIIFNGIWPVGASAVVVGSDTETTRTAKAKFLKAWNAKYPTTPATEIKVKELDHGVVILQDGDY